jgi:transcription elongation factor Elf1
MLMCDVIVAPKYFECYECGKRKTNHTAMQRDENRELN